MWAPASPPHLQAPGGHFLQLGQKVGARVLTPLALGAGETTAARNENGGVKTRAVPRNKNSSKKREWWHETSKRGWDGMDVDNKVRRTQK